jgi:uncharacterized membrane protein YeaQ/YmgE (transglycosylase-associated protein family)
MTAHTYNLLAGLAGAVLAMFALSVLAPNGLLIYLFMLVAGVVIVVISYRNTLEGK